MRSICSGTGSGDEKGIMALREINLIPPDILSRRHLFRRLSLWSGCMIISLSLIFGFYQYYTRAVLTKNSAMTNLKEMHIKLGTKIEKINQIQEELKKLDHQQSLIKTITNNQPYTIVLSKLAALMNEYTWLTQFALDSKNDGEDNADMKLTGFSFSNNKLGDFIDQLSCEPMFTSIFLKYARESNIALPDQNKVKKVKVIQFEIECNLRNR